MVAAIQTETAPTIPQPAAGEEYEHYVVRAHRDLMTAIPEPQERNNAVWSAWSAVHGDHERIRAGQNFPAERFSRRPDVCYFAEHETSKPGPDGQLVPMKYDVGELVSIMRNNNRRIADVDAYSTLIDRHTAAPGQPEFEKPKTLGFAGPYRLGMIGRVQPRFALFVDEYTHKAAASKLMDNPGRSVEVLTLRSTGEKYINPVAAISEAPRLPLPLQYAFGETEEGEVERYSFVAPDSYSLPGGGNTHITKFDATSPDASQTDPTNQEPTGMALSDEDLKRVVQAISSLAPFQWVMQQMQQEGQAQDPMAGDAPAGDPTADPGMQQPPGQPPAQPSKPPGQEQYMGNQYMGGMNLPPKPPQVPAMAQQFSVDADGNIDIEKFQAQFDELTEKYQAVSEDRAEVYSALEATNRRLYELERERSDAVRRERIRDLQGRFPHAVDTDHEFGRCLYSMGAEMDDDAFEDHMSDVEHYAAKAMPTTPMVPSGEMPGRPGNDVETARYAAQEAAEVRRLLNEFTNAGEQKTFNELKALARQNLQGA